MSRFDCQQPSFDMLVAVKPSSQVSSRTRQESKEERMANMKKVTNTSLLRDQGGGPPAKRRRLEAEDLMAFEELDDNFEQEWQSNERFQVIRSIGRGAYATVYKAIDKEHNNAVVAMKKMAFVVDPCHIIPSHIAREITNLRRLHDSTRQTPIIRLEKEGRCPLCRSYLKLQLFSLNYRLIFNLSH